MSEQQVTGVLLGVLLSLGAMASGRLAVRKVTILASWRAYTIAFSIRLIGFLVIAVVLATLPVEVMYRESKAELFLAFVFVLALGLAADIVLFLLQLRKG